MTASKKTASKKKRTPAQRRATAKLVAMNKKKVASRRKKTASRKKVARTRATPRSTRATARKRNPRAPFYAIVRRNASGASNYYYFDGSKFVEPGRSYLKGPKTYMVALAEAVAGEYPTTDIYVKSV